MEREREKERERNGERERGGERERWRETETETERGRWIERESDGEGQDFQSLSHPGPGFSRRNGTGFPVVVLSQVLVGGTGCC